MISTHKKYVIPASTPSINCTLHLLKPVSYRWMAVNDRPWRHQQLQQGARSILLHISQKQRGNSPASPDTKFTTRVFPTPARAWMLASPGGYQSRRGRRQWRPDWKTWRLSVLPVGASCRSVGSVGLCRISPAIKKQWKPGTSRWTSQHQIW